MNYNYEYSRPCVTATIAVFNPTLQKILLVKRGGNAETNKWAFPGGFLDVGKETVEECAVRELEECAVRELEEETGLTVVEMLFR